MRIILFLKFEFYNYDDIFSYLFFVAWINLIAFYNKYSHIFSKQDVEYEKFYPTISHLKNRLESVYSRVKNA